MVEFRYQIDLSDSTFSSCILEDRYMCELALDGDKCEVKYIVPDWGQSKSNMGEKLLSWDFRCILDVIGIKEDY